MHGNVVRKHAGASVIATMANFPGYNIIMGHVHRLAVVHFTSLGKVTQGAEAGCLCHDDPEYIDDPNWQMGFMTRLNNVLIPAKIFGNKLYWGNKVFTYRKYADGEKIEVA
jgi:hypothetical protein